MKIRIAYLPEEAQEAGAVLAALLRLFPAAKVRKTDDHPPYKHTYLTTRKPAKR